MINTKDINRILISRIDEQCSNNNIPYKSTLKQDTTFIYMGVSIQKQSAQRPANLHKEETIKNNKHRGAKEVQNGQLL